MKETAYVIYLQSWADRENPKAKKYLTFEKRPDQDFERIWRKNGIWVDNMSDATIITSKDQVERIAWYYGVAYEEIK